MHLKVNRHLEDPAMNLIDHALGHPVNPMGETYRSYFSANPDSREAVAFSASPHWTEGRHKRGLVWFYVTDEGRTALSKHLEKIGDKYRTFIVTFDGHGTPVAAESHAKARYSMFLDLADCCPDLSFGEFLKLSAVCLAPSAACAVLGGV